MRNFLCSVILLCCLFFFSCTSKTSSGKTITTDTSSHFYLLVGTYTNGTSTGIYVYDLNQETGDSKLVSVSPDISNPSYLAVSNDEHFVFSVFEDDMESASVSSFSFDKTLGNLEYINSEKTNGAHPCYIAVDKERRFITTANYTGGNLSVFPVSKEGHIEPISQLFDYKEDKDTEITSHIHTTFFSPDEKFLFVTDLGRDKIYRYDVNKDTKDKQFLQNQQIAAELEPGSGPRHLAFHPNGNYLYCINELSGKISAFHYNNGILNVIQSIASDTTSGNNKKGSADIHLTPDGKFLYSSNRLKADGLAIFKVNTDGTLTFTDYQSTGIHPRNFIITPNGKLLLVASRDSNNISVFTIDQETGSLKDTEKKILIDKPVCLKMISKS